ncbi:MAG: hypothetical protein AAFY72_04535 [Cyanobacteria bacterium J06649_4]
MTALIKTADRDLVFGSLFGLVTIPPWFLLLPFLAQLPGWPGLVALLSYAAYVAVTLAFHVSYGFIGLAIKVNHALSDRFTPLVNVLKITSFGFALLFSIAWGVAILSAGAPWLYICFGPVSTIVVFLLLLGQFLKRVPYYLIVSGPLAMLTFFGAFLHYFSFHYFSFY